MELIRKKWILKITEEFKVHPVCALLGPRQCGKTTLAHAYKKTTDDPVTFLDCENPFHIARLQNPLLSLEALEGLIVIDEIQLRPDLFPVLRVLVDQNPLQRYLITGSASRDLICQSSETLAGRIGYHNITPFTIEEVDDWRMLWHRGGFPRSYLASDTKFSQRWRGEYIKTFLERDLGRIGFDIPPQLLGKLWRMLAHMHGQILKINDLSVSLNLDPRTVRKYVAALEGAFMIRTLRPWHTNIGKREIKTPKIYIRDSGLLHQLLSLPDIENHPQLGASFEGLALEQVIHFLGDAQECYFWATHNGAELDLLWAQGSRKIGFEFKFSDSPKITKSMHIACDVLELAHLYVVVPEGDVFRMSESITCISLKNLESLLEKLL